VTLTGGVQVTMEGKPAKQADVPVGLAVVVRVSKGTRDVVAIRSGGEPAREERRDARGRHIELQGVVAAVDAQKRTLSVIVGTNRQRSFEVPKDVPVTIDGAEGQFSDLKPLSVATLVMTPDGRQITAVRAEGCSMVVAVKSVDAAKQTLTFDPLSGEKEDRTLTVAADARIAVGRGVTKLADVKAGM